jgi:phosphonate transport system substrate-binding protein
MTFSIKKSVKLSALIVMVGTMLLLAACGSADSAAGDSGMPDKLTVGVLPGEEEGELSRGNQILVDDLSEELGIEVELFVGQDYNAVIEAMRSKKIDLASFGPFSYIIAAERSGAVPFAVKGKSLEDAFYNSWLVVPDESDVQNIEDLEGKSMLFADPASTSGHLFPRTMLVKELGITNDEVESFFSSVSFSGSHDNSIISIANGDAEAAGVCAPCVERAIEGGVVKESDFRIIKKSDPIPSSPMTYREDLPEELVEKVKDFYYNYKNEEFFEQSGDIEARYFEIDDSQYQIIRDTAEALDMSPEQLLE